MADDRPETGGTSLHRIAFLIYPGFEILDVTGPAAVFTGANRALAVAGRAPFYAVITVSAAGGPVTSSSGITVDTLPLAQVHAETLLAAGGEREAVTPALADRALRAALPAAAAQAQRLGSVCSGAFLLAPLGLLDGARIATHWDACTDFARSFPAVQVDDQALYVIDGRLWTSAGVTTGIDMALAMVAQDLDGAIAGTVAKRLVLYARRPGHQSQFSALLSAQTRADSPFAELIGWILSNLTAPLDVAALAERAGQTERTFHRRFQAATGQTPAKFVELARLDAARLLLSRGMMLKEVAAQVGLFPAVRLAEAFERRFGLSPRLYREMHGEL